MAINNDSLNEPETLELRNCGVNIKTTIHVIHHKFFLLETSSSKILITGSNNFNHESYAEYDEAYIVIKNIQQLFDRFLSEYDFIVGHNLNHSKDCEGSSEKILMTSCNYALHHDQLVYQNKHSLEDRLIFEVMVAKKNIKIVNSNFRLKRLVKAIIEKTLNPDFKVFIYLDNQVFDQKNGQWFKSSVMERCLKTEGCGEFTHEWSHYLASLKRPNLQIRIKAYSKVWNFSEASLMHAKFFLVDDLKVLTGSFNLFKASDNHFLENLITLEVREKESQETVLKFKEHFDYLWNRNRDPKKTFSLIYPKSLSIEEFQH